MATVTSSTNMKPRSILDKVADFVAAIQADYQRKDAIMRQVHEQSLKIRLHMSIQEQAQSWERNPPMCPVHNENKILCLAQTPDSEYRIGEYFCQSCHIEKVEARLAELRKVPAPNVLPGYQAGVMVKPYNAAWQAYYNRVAVSAISTCPVSLQLPAPTTPIQNNPVTPIPEVRANLFADVPLVSVLEEPEDDDLTERMEKVPRKNTHTLSIWDQIDNGIFNASTSERETGENEPIKHLEKNWMC